MTDLPVSEIRVALLYGGHGGEREISLASGRACHAALEEAGYDVVPLDPALRRDLVRLVEEDFDVAFLALHGDCGENGSVQGMLETLGIPYTGSGVWASATAMDKARSKACYKDADIPTPSCCSIEGWFELTDEEVDMVIDVVGTPFVVKPACEGSALGVHICTEADQLRPALDEVLAESGKALVEQCITGREITVAVLGNDEPDALPVIEIVPKNEFYDYESKYAPGGSEHICPADLPEAVTEDAMDNAVAAHIALGCRGVSRTDMIVDDEGICWVLETNTLPGMTGTSLLPDAARVTGMDFKDLCSYLVELALEDAQDCCCGEDCEGI